MIEINLLLSILSV